MSNVCPACGTMNPPGGNFCDRCGKPLSGMASPGMGLSKSSWVIGSDPSCDVVLASSTVSGRHCRLSLVGNAYRVEDLGSTNGTFVDGVRIFAPVTISRASQILLGKQVPMPWPVVQPAMPIQPRPWSPPPSPPYPAMAPAYQQASARINPSQFRYAGFWIRWVANLMDFFVVLLGGAIVGFVVGVATGGLAVLIAPLLGLAAGWLYFALMESSKTQGTLGKMALGLKVIDYEGRRVSFGRASGRYFSKIISSILLYIGFMMAGWTEKKQGLHDMIAGTYVLKTRE